MWTLSTGTVVELKMEELSKKCNYDHPCHSLIFDPEDVTWNIFFTTEELDEIRQFGNPTFESVPISNIIASLNNKNSQQMHEVISGQYFNPLTDAYNYWTKKPVTEGLDILMTNKLQLNVDSEDEIIDRIWKIIPWAFDQGQIVSKREQTSEISTEQMNQKRRLSSVEKIGRQKTGKRIDMLFKYDDYELGVYEAKRSFKEYCDGVISDQHLKVPKIMKDMIIKLLTVAPTKLRQIETVGIITSDTNRVIDFIDEEKYKEKNKQSGRYRLLKLIWTVIIDFERLSAPNATETLFSSNFEMLLTIMFQDRNISIESGEIVSDATSRAATANGRSASDFGRRIDVISRNFCYGIRNEYICIEFKRQDAKTSLLTCQQSKSTRINGTILNDLIVMWWSSTQYCLCIQY